MKFRGTSGGDVPAFERVVEIVAAQLEKRAAVGVSALRKVTDALLGAFDKAKKGDADEAFAELGPHFERHIKVAESFIPPEKRNAFDKEIGYAREELADLLTRAARRSLPLSMLKDAVV